MVGRYERYFLQEDAEELKVRFCCIEWCFAKVVLLSFLFISTVFFFFFLWVWFVLFVCGGLMMGSEVALVNVIGGTRFTLNFC